MVQDLSAATPKLVYIVSRGHSGSTVLELLLNKSRYIAAMGEIDLLPLQLFRDEHTRWVGRCSCGEKPVDCPIWREVLNRLVDIYGDRVLKPLAWSVSDVGIAEETRELLPSLVHRMSRGFRWSLAYMNPPRQLAIGPYQTWVRRREAIMREYARVQAVEWLVDASKDPLQMLDVARYSTSPVKVLFLTRDVRGVAWSAIKSGRSDAYHESRAWATLNRRILHLVNRLDPAMWIKIHYEDLCADPESTLNRVNEFLGLPTSYLSEEEELRKRHTIAGNKVRFYPLGEIREDRLWEANLSQGQIEIIRSQAGDVATSLGYEI